MLRMSLFLLGCLSATNAWAKIDIQKVQPAHGLLGPARATDDVYPLDEYYVRFQVTGIQPDKEGKADLELAVRLLSPDGKAVVDTKGPLVKVLNVGGTSLQTFGMVSFPEKAPVGEYKLSITVRDRVASESASFERKLTCKAPTFAILMPRFFHDAEAKFPAATKGFVGANVTFRCRVVGFDRSQQKVALVLKIQLRDADDKEIGAKPIIVNGDITDPDKVSKATQANFNSTLFLHRAGSYKMIVTVEDTIAKKSTTYETMLTIVEP